MSDARYLEQKFDDDELYCMKGQRRYAWIWPSDIRRKYLPEKAHYELSFALPKGAYATNVVDMLRGAGG
jgi:tRNA pseudouridine13 synthase